MDQVINFPPTDEEKQIYFMGPDWELQTVDRHLVGTSTPETLHTRAKLVSLTYRNINTGYVQIVPVNP